MTSSTKKSTMIIVLLLTVGASFASAERIDISFKDIICKLKSQQIASKFIEESATFAFDGISDSLQMEDIIAQECTNCWTITFKFSCLNAGYGDRSETIVSPVITPHNATITLDQYEVIYADLDGRWDMINQEMLPYVEGNCTYQEIEGMARIISIREPAANSRACRNGMEVIFEFFPNDPLAPMNYLFPDWPDSEQYLTVGRGMHPPYDYLESENIVEGNLYPCIRSELIEGNCTQVIFSFPGLDPYSWENSCY